MKVELRREVPHASDRSTSIYIIIIYNNRVSSSVCQVLCNILDVFVGR